MKIKKTMKKICAYICVVAVTVASMAGYQAKVSAAVPDGYTALDTQGWHSLGEDIKYTIGTDNDPASEWSVYTGNNWSGVVAAVKDGADGQNTVSIYVENGANEQWGLQLGKVFDGLEAGKQYAYQIDFTLDGSARKWIDVVTADENGQVKIVKPLGTLVGTGKTLTVTNASVFDPETNENTKYMAWLNTSRNLAKDGNVTVSNHKEGSTNHKVLTDGVCMSWSSYVGVATPGYFEVDLGQEYAASSIDQVVVWFRNGNESLYPKNGFRVQFGNLIYSDAAKLTTYPTGGSTSQADGEQFMVPVVIDKTKVEGNVRKVIIQVDDSVGWGTQISEIAVFSENPQGPVEVPEAADAAAVEVSSTPSTDLTGNIKFKITAGENQTDYKYAVFVDDSETASKTDCVAGTEYTINGVETGEHTIKVVSVYQGGISKGLVSDKVNVSTKLDGYVKLATQGWHPLGESRDYSIGDDNQPASEWNIYTGNDWSGVIARAKDGADGQTTMSLYVEKKPNQAWGLQLGKIFAGLEPNAEYSYKIEYTNDSVAGSWEGLLTADSNGTAKLTKDLSNVVADGKFFTITNVIVKAPATNAAAVTVSSEKSNALVGDIKFNITAAEGQEDYKYDVYLDAETTAAMTGCVAGQDYTISGVSAGKHTLTVVSVYDGSISSGLKSEEVEVKTILNDVTDYTKNFAYGDAWELMGDNSTEGTGSITDGIVSGDDYATPTKGVDGSYFIIDLGEECNVADIDSVLTCYRIDHGGCYPGDGGMLIEYSNDKEIWTTAATITQNEFNTQKATQNGAPFGIVADVSGNTEGTVRYVKVSCPKAVAYGMQVTEIAIFGTVPESQIPKAPATPEGLVADGTTPYTFNWNAVEGALSYNVYINGALAGTSATNTYNAYSYFVTAGAGKYTVEVSAVGKANLESGKASLEYTAEAIKPTISEDGNYMVNPQWDLYTGADWIWCDGTLSQDNGAIKGDFATTGGGWDGAVWGIKATSDYVVVEAGKKYVYSANIKATKDMKIRIQVAGTDQTISVKANELTTYAVDIVPNSNAINVVFAMGGVENGTVTDVQFTIDNHRVHVKEVETTTEKPTIVNPTTEKPTTPVTTTAPKKAVKVARVKVKSATKKKTAKKIKISLRRIKGVKYQVQVAKAKKFTKKNILQKKTVKKATFSLTSKKYKNRKKLYVRIRAIKVVGGKTYTGKWSTVKKVRIKK